jgi:hypothetical protein
MRKRMIDLEVKEDRWEHVSISSHIVAVPLVPCKYSNRKTGALMAIVSLVIHQ